MVDIILEIYKYGFLVCLLLSAALGFVVMMTRSIIKPVLAAKLTNNMVECKLNNDGTADFSALVKYKGIMFNKDGEPIQEYKRFKSPDEKELVIQKYNVDKLKNAGYQRKIKPLFYYFSSLGGLKIGFRREGDITFIDETGNPAPIDQPWLEKIFNVYYSAIMKLKKMFKKKAWSFPLWFLILLVGGVAAIFIVLKLFVL